MTDDLQQLEDWIDPLLERIEPAERRRRPVGGPAPVEPFSPSTTTWSTAA